MKCGGERGIRTLDTGVSPYNGLANLVTFASPRTINHLESSSAPKQHVKRAE
jgi:hypothetical protein